MMNLIKFFTKRIRAREVLHFIEDLPEKQVLDIGCGDCFFLKRLAKIQKYGVDKKLGVGKKEAEKNGISLKEEKITGRLPYKDGFFDYVTMLAVIEHFENPEQILQEAFRVLKKNGLLIITTPLKRAEKVIKLYSPRDLEEHKGYFSRAFFESLEGYELVHLKRFELGLNQLFVLRKR